MRVVVLDTAFNYFFPSYFYVRIHKTFNRAICTHQRVHAQHADLNHGWRQVIYALRARLYVAHGIRATRRITDIAICRKIFIKLILFHRWCRKTVKCLAVRPARIKTSIDHRFYVENERLKRYSRGPDVH